MKIKRIVSLTLSLIMLCSLTFQSFAMEKNLNSMTDTTIVSDGLETKEEVLKSIWQQLESQNATKFYPMYEQMIEERFNESSRYSIMSSSNVYMPKGGAVYYSNYLNTGTEVYQTYLDQAATQKALDGNLTTDILDGFVSFGLGSLWWPLGLLTTLANVADREIARQITNGTGRMELMYSDDGDTSAKIKLHWADAPYVRVYSGGQTSIVK